MKYKCPKCGYVFTGEVSYCPNCGLKLKYHKDEKPELKNDNQNNTNEAPANTFANQTVQLNNTPVINTSKPAPAPQPEVQTANVQQPIPQSFNQQTYDNQTSPQTTQAPEPEKKSNAHNVFAFICSIIAAGFLGAALLLPIYSCSVGGTDLFASYLDLLVYLITLVLAGGVDFGNPGSLISYVAVAAPAALVALFMTIASILTLCAFIINLVRMIKRAPYKDSYRGNGITALMILMLVFMAATCYLPQLLYIYLHDLFPEFEIIITYIWVILALSLVGTFVMYLVLRIIYRALRNKAE